MDIEKLIRRLRNDADAYRNGETLGRAFADQEDVLDKAATALSTLQAENEKLRGELEYEQEHANAYHQECGQWEAENEKLRAELNDLKSKWDKYQPREHWETLNELCENLHDELEKVKAERDAALEHLHGICSACKNYSPYHNRGKCRFCAYEPARDKDAEANDNWEWRGPQKED